MVFIPPSGKAAQLRERKARQQRLAADMVQGMMEETRDSQGWLGTRKVFGVGMAGVRTRTRSCVSDGVV